MSSSYATHPIFIFLIFFSVCTFSDASSPHGEEEALVLWKRSMAEEAPPLARNTSFILAADRTNRKDPANRLQYYTGGWNITNEHYWTSVAYSAYPLFLAAIVWFAIFGLVLLLMCCCCCCCCRKRKYSYSRVAYALSLILLIIFTCAAIAGCAVLYEAQRRFHRSTSDTLDYVIGKANFTVDNLRNFSNNLANAKNVSVEQVLLPGDVKSKIDVVEKKLNWAANELVSRTKDNSGKIRNVLMMVRLELNVLAAVMLALAFLGFLFSLLGLQFFVYILVFLGWILIAATFVLAGVFIVFHNVVADTCESMEEWVQRPQAHTALDDILPCVDASTAYESLYRSKEVTFQLANVANQVISNLSNNNIPPFLGPPLYFNQSGPLMPLLCNPYSPDMKNRSCVASEVDLADAAKVWNAYICKTKKSDGADICTTTGRLTPSMYGQLRAAVSISQGLYHYAPFLADLQDCTFVRDAFTHISEHECLGLEQSSKSISFGLTIVAAAELLSLLFWVLYARERRHRGYNKQMVARSAGRAPVPLAKAP